MSETAQASHRTLSQRVYSETLETAKSDRTLLPDSLLMHDSPITDASPALLSLYHSYTWAAHSFKARSWLQSVFIFNIMLMPFDYLLDASLLTATLIIRGGIASAIFLALHSLWGRQRAGWVQGGSLLIVSMTIMLEAGALGSLGGIPLFEHYLTAGLFTAATAILFFPIGYAWTIAAVIITVSLYGAMMLFGPVADPVPAISMSLFYTCAIMVFANTRRATLISQWKSFKAKIRELRDQERLGQLYTELQKVANLDPLTGVQNRRSIEEDIDRIWTDSLHAKSGIAFLMLDIDNFKKLNDTLGHAAGDECIKQVADSISSQLGDRGIVSRYGGEEFLLVLPSATSDSALDTAERVRKTIEALGILNPGNDAGRVTVSIGLAMWKGDRTSQMLVDRADKALYRAKQSGKNRTIVAEPSEGESIAPAPADTCDQTC